MEAVDKEEQKLNHLHKRSQRKGKTIRGRTAGQCVSPDKGSPSRAHYGYAFILPREAAAAHSKSTLPILPRLLSALFC